MPRPLKDIIAHIRAVAADASISTTLIQTEDLLALCDAAEGVPPNPPGQLPIPKLKDVLREMSHGEKTAAELFRFGVKQLS